MLGITVLSGAVWGGGSENIVNNGPVSPAGFFLGCLVFFAAMGWFPARRGHGGKQALAAELLASLFDGGGGHRGGRGGGTPGQRGPQWHCSSCGGLPNDTTRKACRGCGGKRAACEAAASTRKGKDGDTAAKSGTRTVSAEGSPPETAAVPPRPWPRGPAPEERAAAAATKAGALEAAAESLREAGLETEAAGHAKAAAALRKAAAPESAGGRLDACARFVVRAERCVAGAKEAVAAAEAAFHEARATQQRLEEELADGRRRLDELRVALSEPAPSLATVPGPSAGFVSDVQALLQGLENGGWASAATPPPEPVLAAMRRLHMAVAESAPLPAPRLDAPLEPDTSRALAPDAPDAAATVVPDGSDGDAAMGELTDVDSDDEAALAGIALRLKRARHRR